MKLLLYNLVLQNGFSVLVPYGTASLPAQATNTELWELDYQKKARSLSEIASIFCFKNYSILVWLHKLI